MQSYTVSDFFALSFVLDVYLYTNRQKHIDICHFFVRNACMSINADGYFCTHTNKHLHHRYQKFIWNVRECTTFILLFCLCSSFLCLPLLFCLYPLPSHLFGNDDGWDVVSLLSTLFAVLIPLFLFQQITA